MGMQINYETASGINCSEAYVRVTRITLSYTESRAWIEVAIYRDLSARIDEKKPLSLKEYRVYNQLILGTPTIYEIDPETEEETETVLQEGTDPYLGDFEYYFNIEDKLTQLDKNCIQQAYEYLKTLPEYEGAVDVLNWDTEE